jgi:hypothetical protein
MGALAPPQSHFLTTAPRESSVPETAVAYLNWGRWVADCASDRCTNALEVEPGQETFVCRGPAPQYAGCGNSAPLQWPDDVAAVQQAVADLPESQQQWTPEPEVTP